VLCILICSTHSASYSLRSIHVVSLVHSVIILFLAIRAIGIPSLEKDRAFAWDDQVGFLAAVAAGYVVYSSHEHKRLKLIFVLFYSPEGTSCGTRLMLL
jgi:hypothetical protein